jgi:hypothetical protein
MNTKIARGLAPVALVTVLSLPLASRADAPPSPAAATNPTPAPSTASQPGTLATIKPMSEDMRVKADDIDGVMANPKMFFLDVREPKEIEELGSYEGYVNIPMSQLESRLGELPKDRPILTA